MQSYNRIGILVCLLALLVGTVVIGVNSAESTIPATCEPDCRANHNSPMGTNLTPVNDWSSEYPFIDAFKLSRPWITHGEDNWPWDTNEQDRLDLDDEGWVRSLPAMGASTSYQEVGTLMFTKMGDRYPEGEYIVLYDGLGTLEYGLDARKVYTKSVLGRDVIQVTHANTIGDGGIHLKITATDPFFEGNYIRNIRVLMPGFTEADLAADTFHPDFLQSISPYKVLRFMDWMRTNYEPTFRAATRSADIEFEMVHPLDQQAYNPMLNQTDWDVDVDVSGRAPLTDTMWLSRSLVTDVRYSTDLGVPAEIMVTLANETGADPWFNMPHQATDAYVTAFATLVHDSLSSERLVFVEYSNEVWNGGFGQALWVAEQGQAEWPDSGLDQYRLRYMWHGMRSSQVCNLWKAAWGEDADRIKCALNTQATNSFVGNTMLDCDQWTESPCDQYHDVLAIAPYFGQHIGHAVHQAELEAWASEPITGLNQLFGEIMTGTVLTTTPSYLFKASLPNISLKMQEYGNLAAARGLSMLAYEGGQHLVGVGATQWNPDIANLFAEANRDPRMATAYADYLEMWHAAGGEIFVHYTSTSINSPYGNWGAQEYYDEPTAVKSPSIMEHIETNECDWAVCSVSIVPVTPTPSPTPVPPRYDVWVPVVLHEAGSMAYPVP